LTNNNITNHITIADDNKLDQTPDGIILHDDGQRINHVASYDIIIRTAGVNPDQAALIDYQDCITSQTQIFFGNYTGHTIGVTGTKGKSTTSTLIHRILTAAGHDTALVGNIGNPVLSQIDLHDTTKQPDRVVYELSSFQLTHASIDPDYALITNLLADHLDRHGDMERYHAAKTHIAGPNTTLIAHASTVDRLSALLPDQSIIYAGNATEYDYDMSMFATPDRYYPCDIALPGDHNRQNVCLINALCHQLDILPNTIYEAIRDFTGLPHRLQLVSTAHSIERYDDSQSTNPTTCIMALRTLGHRTDTLMLGGYQSHFDYSELITELEQYDIPNIILFPDTINDFKKHLDTDRYQIYEASSMSDAVQRARDHTAPQTICLLSPAAKSFSLWTSMSQRGKQFLECIQTLDNKA
jgi:UDP-N-acetylmuramoylalanine--D-glutamate ligase